MVHPFIIITFLLYVHGSIVPEIVFGSWFDFLWTVYWMVLISVERSNGNWKEIAPSYLDTTEAFISIWTPYLLSKSQ